MHGCHSIIMECPAGWKGVSSSHFHKCAHMMLQNEKKTKHLRVKHCSTESLALHMSSPAMLQSEATSSALGLAQKTTDTTPLP